MTPVDLLILLTASITTAVVVNLYIADKPITCRLGRHQWATITTASDKCEHHGYHAASIETCRRCNEMQLTFDGDTYQLEDLNNYAQLHMPLRTTENE